MSGRPKQKRYEYNQDGKFIREYVCENDIRKEYYAEDKGKRPLFGTTKTNHKGKVYSYNYSYHILKNNNIIVKERIGREGIKNLIKHINNDFVKIYNKKKINVINLDNEIIASFISENIAAKMTNIPISTIHNQLTKGKGFSTDRGLIFKYD
jgi:hypothetical protein